MSTSDAAKLRAFWAHRQGLLYPKPSGAGAILEQTGWARAVGGSNPYLTLVARGHRASRTDMDTALANLEICTLPSARGCTYTLPASHFALGLSLARAYSSREPDMAIKYLGVTQNELDLLSEAVTKVLREQGPLDSSSLRKELGDLVRSLGEEGKKRGLNNTLSVVLGPLQDSGLIRRVSSDGRLDTEKWKYAVWQDTALTAPSLAEAGPMLAKLYWQWLGLATLGNFRWFSGFTVAQAKQAVDGLGLQPLSEGSDLLGTPDSLEEFAEFSVPSVPCIALVSSLDGVSLLRREPATLLDGETEIYTAKGLKSAGALQDLPANPIMDRGEVIGLWEYDPEGEGKVLSRFFGEARPEAKAPLLAMEMFLREELGDCKSHSLDSPKTRRPLLDWLTS